ncbi:PHP domain-containing protein [Lysinibacillus telephonicus]
MHTTCSDGEMTPGEILQLGIDQQLEIMSIADHDSLDAYFELAKNPLQISPKMLVGMEFNTDGPNGELHILGFGLDPTYPALKQYCEFRKNERINWSKSIVQKLQQLGFSIKWENCFQRAKGGIIVRTHIADELVAIGAFPTAKHAYETLLIKGAPAYIERAGKTSKGAIDLIHEAGGLAFLAHPGIYSFNFEFENILKEGIDGIEVFYALHKKQTMNYWYEVAKQHDLYMSVGSDFHGFTSKNPQMIGSVPFEEEELMKWIPQLLEKKVQQ